MGNKTLFAAGIVLVASVVALLAGAAPTSQGTAARWEYKFVLADSGNPEQPSFKRGDPPNVLGDEGWELVSVAPKGELQLWLAYKRRK